MDGNTGLEAARFRATIRKGLCDSPSSGESDDQRTVGAGGLSQRDAVSGRRGAADAIEFYKKAFGAKEMMRMPGPSGKVGHAEIEIGGSRIMLADEYPDMDFRSPKAFGGRRSTCISTSPDVDAVARQAVAAGAKEVRPVKDQFYGDRTGSIEDPFGHVWHIATRKEDLSEGELKRRAAEAMQQGG